MGVVAQGVSQGKSQNRGQSPQNRTKKNRALTPNPRGAEAGGTISQCLTGALAWPWSATLRR